MFTIRTIGNAVQIEGLEIPGASDEPLLVSDQSDIDKIKRYLKVNKQLQYQYVVVEVQKPEPKKPEPKKPEPKKPEPKKAAPKAKKAKPLGRG